jgi:hypothetical protein
MLTFTHLTFSLLHHLISSPQALVLESMKDLDYSVKKKALSLLFSISDDSNAKGIVEELVVILATAGSCLVMCCVLCFVLRFVLRIVACHVSLFMCSAALSAFHRHLVSHL